MINGLEGIPGSGKSYEAVVYHVLPALQKGRKVITNLPLLVEMFVSLDPAYAALIEVRTRPKPVIGTWSAERVDEHGKGSAFELFEDGHSEPAAVTVSVFGHVWDYYSTWKHEDGSGPLFVIDECHVPLPATGTSSQVIEYYKLHRHFNVDILLGTQSYRDMNQSIARLMGVIVKVRKADILGRSGSYIRKVHAGYRGAVISVEERKYIPSMFALYKSHTQGRGVAEHGASDVTPFLVKFNRLRNVVWVLALIAVAYAAWFNLSPTRKAAHASTQPVAVVAASSQKPVALSGDAPGTKQDRPASKPETVQPQSIDEDPEPFEKKLVHLSGVMRMGGRVLYTFTLSQGGARVLDMTLDEVKSAGYSYRSTGDCTGVLIWKNIRRAVMCDAPRLTTGEKSMPVVVAIPGVSPRT